MEQTPITINMGPSYDGSKPIIVHLMEGQTPEPINPKSCSISGNIDAVSDFLLMREKVWGKDDVAEWKRISHILVDKEAGTIVLNMYEKHPHSTTVSSKIELNPELSKFGINREKRYSAQELASTIKLNRAYFIDHKSHTDFLKNLKNVDATISAAFKEATDDRGNENESYVTKLASNIDERFTLNMPVFKGSSDKKTFEVNVCLQIRDKGISIWLESVELEELYKSAMDAVMNAKIDEFRKRDYTVIVK